ncbi:MAG: hypothetical protein ACRDJO_02595 [Actinomycetota bacterium]
MPDIRDAAEPRPPVFPAAGQDYGPPSRWEFRPPHPVGSGDIVEMPAGQATA